MPNFHPENFFQFISKSSTRKILLCVPRMCAYLLLKLIIVKELVFSVTKNMVIKQENLLNYVN